jgi:hypothetical protein
LAGDKQALADLTQHLQGDMDSIKSTTAEWIPPEKWMSRILWFAGQSAGISDQQLRQWSRADLSEGIRWGVDIGLARRGDQAALARVYQTLDDKFELRPQEEEAADWEVPGGRPAVVHDPAKFRFVIEVADSSFPGRWPRLLTLLSVRREDEDLLAPQVATILALDQHWAELDPATQESARNIIRKAAYEKENQWLQSMMITFLAGHPHNSTTLIFGDAIRNSY